MRSRSNTNVSVSENSFWNNNSPTNGLFDVLFSVWRYVVTI
jgi:hypothetical protein